MRYGDKNVTMHLFLAVMYKDKLWFLDPSWQQFLPLPDDSKPPELWVEADKIVERLREYGVSEERHHVWLDALPIPNSET